MSARVVDTVLAVALCVGAGVLLSTVFIHMVPETRESLDIAAAQGYLPGRKEGRKRRIILMLSRIRIKDAVKVYTVCILK